MDITIRHHFTKKSFRLNTYHHKGYWYYGKKREHYSMKRFSELIKPGMTIAEIGGHIGYISAFFSSLIGNSGKLTVFEPGKNNLVYLRKNLGYCENENILIEELAAGEKNCEMFFYLDPITGQNNTLVNDFEGFEVNRKLSAQPNAVFKVDKVNVVRLDDYFTNHDLPDFVKIDIEGYEWQCLEGFKGTIIRKRPVLMVEIQSNEEKIFNFFKSINYRVFNDRMDEIDIYENFNKLRSANIFFLP